MDSSATNHPVSDAEITAGERKTHRSRHPQEKIERINLLLSKGLSNLAIARDVMVSRECVQFYRARSRREGLAVATKYDPASDKRIYETEAQSEAFARAIRNSTGASNDVRTKSTGRIGCPNPTHVMAESNLARCG